MKALAEVNVDRRQTVLLSSHIISDIERVASHIAILHNGRITCHEALDEIRERVGSVTLTEPPSAQGKVLASHGDRHWVWDPGEYDFPPEVRVDKVVLEDLFEGITSR